MAKEPPAGILLLPVRILDDVPVDIAPEVLVVGLDLATKVVLHFFPDSGVLGVAPLILDLLGTHVDEPNLPGVPRVVEGSGADGDTAVVEHVDR
jgi:hypothetical protein